MASFANDRDTQSDDSIFCSGPTCDEFLSHLRAQMHENPPLCPYGRRCTYGYKCKFLHPEREPFPHKSVTERSQGHGRKRLMEVKAEATVSRSAGDRLKGISLSHHLQPASSDQDSGRSKRKYRKTSSNHQRSTFVKPLSAMLPNVMESNTRLSVASPLSHPDCWNMGTSSGENGHIALPHQHELGSGHDVQPIGAISPSAGFNQLYYPQSLPIGMQQQWGQVVREPGNPAVPQADISYGEPKQMAERLSDSDRNGEEINLHQRLQGQLILYPIFDPRPFQMQGYVPSNEHQTFVHQACVEAPSPGVTASPVHQNVTSIASAPDSFQRWPQVSDSGLNSDGHYILPQTLILGHQNMQRLSSTSDPQLNLGGEGEKVASDPFQGRLWIPHTLEPSRYVLSANAMYPVSAVLQPTTAQSYSSDGPEDAVRRLQYHLSSIFPAEIVRRAMEIHPNETNPQILCSTILSFFQNF